MAGIMAWFVAHWVQMVAAAVAVDGLIVEIFPKSTLAAKLFAFLKSQQK